MSVVDPGTHTVSLREAAETLGVHYMTAYRYVRKGKLPAVKVDNEYRVEPADVAALRDPTIGPKPSTELLQARLVASDEPGAWMIIETALDSGLPPARIYTDLLIPSINRIGIVHGANMDSVHKVHQATAVTTRLMARLGPLFRRRGSAKARVLIGAVANDTHALAPAMMADLLRCARFDVIDLGADTPADSFARAVADNPGIGVVALTSTSAGNDDEIVTTIRTIRSEAPVPILLGGRGVVSTDHARSLGADGWAEDLDSALMLFHLHTNTTPDTVSE